MTAGIASVAASILVPSVVIAAYSLVAREPHRITAFALAVAEPLALVGAIAATGIVAFRSGRRRPRALRWGARLGVVAAACMLGTAYWVHDVDGWTGAAVALLPAAGMAAARWAARRAGAASRAVHAHCENEMLYAPVPDGLAIGRQPAASDRLERQR